MKNTLIFLFIALISFPSFCQIEWAGNYHTYGDQRTFIVTSQGDHVICNNDSYFPYLVAINTEGLEVYDFSEPLLEDGWLDYISDVIELKDSSIVFPYVEIVVDGGGQAYISFNFGTVDKNWDNFGICYHGLEAFSGASLISSPLSDNSLVIYDPESYVSQKTNKDCQNEWQDGINFFALDLTSTSDDRLIWAGNNGLTIMDSDGNIDTTYSDLFFEKIQTTSFDGFVGLREDSLFLIGSDFNLLAFQDFPDDIVLDFSVAHEKVAVLTENKMVHLFSDSLVFSNSFELFDESKFELIDIGNDGLGFAGVETYGSAMPSGGTKVLFTKSYSFDGDNYDMSRNIGVVEVQLGEVTHVAEDPIFPDEFRVYFDDATVTVENFGDETVEDFYVRSKFTRQFFNDVSLSANESITLELNGLWMRSSAGLGGTESLCLWTSHPDGRLDENSTNDGLCSDFIVNDEEVFTETSFNIYPNPAGYFLKIQMPDSPSFSDGHLKIINGQGIEIYSWKNENLTPEITLSIQDWPSGIYFLQYLENGEVRATERFVVGQ